jgi:hypothetical protein
MYAASALEIMRSTRSIPVLFRALKQHDPPPYLRDEIILAIAGVTGMGDWFYPLYSEFLERARRGVSELLSALKDCPTDPETDSELGEAITMMLQHREEFGTAIARFFERCTNIEGSIGKEAAPEFIAAAHDPALLRFDRLAFLLAAAAVYLACRYTPQNDL